MGSVLQEIVIDSRDPAELARWWARVLDWQVVDSEHGYSWISPDGQPQDSPLLVFVPGQEPKTVKNRVHLDVSPSGVDEQQELQRLLALGAAHTDIGQADVPWIVLADPEGNEFCLLSGRVEQPA
jgi:hypothetical protein